MSKTGLYLLALGLLGLASCSGSPDTTLREKLLQIEKSIESCPNISGSYEFIGTSLVDIPGLWIKKRVAFDHLLRLDKLLEDRNSINEVEIQHSDRMQVIFKNDQGKEVLELPERSMDHIGCTKGQIIQIRMRDAYGEAVSGKKVIKNLYFKNPDGSLTMFVEVIAYLRSLPFFYKSEETYGARFAPAQHK